MGRGLPLLAVAAAVIAAATSSTTRSQAAEPAAPECVGRTLSELAWSRNGRWLAFNRPVAPRAFALTLVDFRTGRFRTLRTSDKDFGISWSPAGTTLLAASGQAIYAGSPTRKMRLVAPGCFGAWSPKARRMAFATGGWVVTSNVDGRAKKRIVRADGVQSWSADGRRLALLRRVPADCRPSATRALRLFVYRFDGRVLTKVTGDHRVVGDRPRYRGDQSRSSFSPNSRSLVYSEDTPCAPGWRVVDAPPETFLVGRAAPLGPGLPTWAPSSRLLALDGLRIPSARVVTLTGEVLRWFPGRRVAWSPDSTRIVFNRHVADSTSGSRAGLFVAVVRGGEPAREIARDAEHPAWSPDGATIAFLRTTASPFPCRHELFIVSAAGGEPRRLVGC
jgi:Tol biopolymer transport system component